MAASPLDAHRSAPEDLRERIAAERRGGLEIDVVPQHEKRRKLAALAFGNGLVIDRDL
jgi:hypothetical protein